MSILAASAAVKAASRAVFGLGNSTPPPDFRRITPYRRRYASHQTGSASLPSPHPRRIAAPRPLAASLLPWPPCAYGKESGSQAQGWVSGFHPEVPVTFSQVGTRPSPACDSVTWGQDHYNRCSVVIAGPWQMDFPSSPWDGVEYVDGEFIGEEDFEGHVLVHTYSGGEEITNRPVALNFDRDNWNVPQIVTVTSHHDLDGIDEPVFTILHFLDMNHHPFSETDDPDYVLQTFGVRVTVTGDDRPGVSISAASLAIDGGDPVGRGAAAVSFEHKPHDGQARVEGPHQEAAPQERSEGRHPHADGCGSGRHAGSVQGHVRAKGRSALPWIG